MPASPPAEGRILRENDRLAADLRAAIARRGFLCLNLISSPGAGKTTLLERTLGMLPAPTRAAVLTGDIQTDNDARRIARAGFEDARVIVEVHDQPTRAVLATTRYGGTRIVDMLVGDPLSRIC